MSPFAWETSLHWSAVALYIAGTVGFAWALIFVRPEKVRGALWVTAAGLLPHTAALLLRYLRVGHGPYVLKYEMLSSNAWVAIAMLLFFVWRRPAWALLVLGNRVGALASDPALLTVVTQPAPPQLDPLSSFLPDGSLRLFFHGDAGFTYAIEVSTDLAGWDTLATVFSADGTVEHFDADAAANSLRFYRVRWLP